MRRKWMAFFIYVLVLGIIPFGESRGVPRREGDAPAQTDLGAALAITHGPYLQLPTSTSMTIVWHTNKKCVSKVEYGTGDELGMTAINSRNGLIDNDRTSHVIRINGLKPGRSTSVSAPITSSKSV